MVIGSRRRVHMGPRVAFKNPILIFIVLSLVTVLFGVITAAIWQRQSEYAANGVTTQAVIVDKDMDTRTTRNRVQRTFDITYEFVLDGRTLRGASGVSEQQFNASNLGDTLDIIYMPDNPTLNIPTANQGMGMAYILAGATGIWAVVALGYGAVKFVLPFAFLRRSAD